MRSAIFSLNLQTWGLGSMFKITYLIVKTLVQINFYTCYLHVCCFLLKDVVVLHLHLCFQFLYRATSLCAHQVLCWLYSFDWFLPLPRGPQFVLLTLDIHCEVVTSSCFATWFCSSCQKRIALQHTGLALGTHPTQCALESCWENIAPGRLCIKSKKEMWSTVALRFPICFYLVHH